MLESPSASVQSELFGSEICALSFLFGIETTVLAELAGGGGDAAQQTAEIQAKAHRQSEYKRPSFGSQHAAHVCQDVS